MIGQPGNSLRELLRSSWSGWRTRGFFRRRTAGPDPDFAEIEYMRCKNANNREINGKQLLLEEKIIFFKRRRRK